MGSLPRRFVFMVVAVVSTKNIVDAVLREEFGHNEAAVEPYRHDFDSLKDACKSSVQTEDRAGMRTCAWTVRQQMTGDNCPEHNFFTGYIEGHIRGCLLGRDNVVCSCENREECFKEVDIQDAHYSEAAVREELRCIRDQWQNRRVKRDDDTSNDTNANAGDTSSKPSTQTTTTAPTTTTTQTTTKTTTTEKKTTTSTTTTTEETTTTTEEEDDEETETPSTWAPTISTTRTPRTTTTTVTTFGDYTDFVDRGTKGPAKEEPTIDDEEEEEATSKATEKTTKSRATRRTRKPKETKGTKSTKRTDTGEEDTTMGDVEKIGRIILVNENYTAFILTILGAVASTLLLLIIIVIKMWFKLERRERLREIKSEARRSRRPSRSRRR